eukprot:m.85022 g.85022  ORF g.85022 m.85022 type:complete len:367 (+) comp14702_c0_seq2:147-1247(+)
MNNFSFRRSRRKSNRNSRKASTTPKMAMLGRTDEEEGFFDLILKLQGGSRMENQRSTGPRQGGDYVLNLLGSGAVEEDDVLPTPPPPASLPHPPQDVYANTAQASLSPEAATRERLSSRGSMASRSATGSASAAASVVNEPLYEAPDRTYEAPDEAALASLAATNASLPPTADPAINRSVSLRASPQSAPIPMPQRAASQRARPLPATPPRPSLGPGAPLPTLAENNAPGGRMTVKQEEAQMAEHTWFVGDMDRKEAEALLRHWPTGTFVVRQGRSSRVITLKFPVAKAKTFFHVRITYEEPMYRVADTECFSTIPELVDFYVDKPHRFFRGMAPEERTKHKLLPYRPLPRLTLAEQPLTAEASEA